jgi:hypothetical protein
VKNGSVAVNYAWSFTTGATADPANLAVAVPLNQAVSATFTEAINPLTIEGAGHDLDHGNGVL